MSWGEAARQLWSAMSNQVVRGKLTLSLYSKGGTRTMLNGIGLEGEVHQQIELLLPYGMSALPAGRTADYLVLQVNAVRDHKVALGPDDPALRIPDLWTGEFGFRNSRGSQVVFRGDQIEITAPLDPINIKAEAGNINIVAGEGAIELASAGGFSLAVSAGNISISAVGNVALSATGTLTLSAPAGKITANGNILG